MKVAPEGSGLRGDTIEKLVYADPADLPTFRPICVSNGPDGALYFCDWAQTIIGHLQHHLRDPNRDHQHGRIYRITYNGRPLLKPAKIDGQPIAALLDLLKEHEDDTRQLAKVELGKHDAAKVTAALAPWIAALDPADPNHQHHLTEALWLSQWMNALDVPLLKRQLGSPVPEARAAAVRVLCYGRTSVPDALSLLKTAAQDADPRVRLQAVRAASFFDGKDVPAATDVAYAVLKKETDYYIDYVLKETLRQLGTLSEEPILPSDPAVLSQVIERMSDAELAKAPNVEPVLIARLERKGTAVDQRIRTLKILTRLHKSEPAAELAAALRRMDARGGGALEELGKMLVLLPAAELGKSRAALLSLSQEAKTPSARRATWAAIISADGDAVKTWADAQTPAAKAALLQALIFIPDPTQRAKFQPLLLTAVKDPAIQAAALQAMPLTGAANAAANFPVIAAALKDGSHRVIAARALVQLPRESWEKAAAAPLAESILAWAKSVPAKDRTQQDFIEIVQAGNELAALLTAPDSARMQKELRSLGVSVFVVKTVLEQMRYDTARLVVEAGKSFEVIFENIDVMPHNLVFVQPGTRQAVSEAVQTQPPEKLDEKGRAYVPKNDARVFGGSKLVEPGQKETLKITAPKSEGDYEYVCTFPGHWPIMWGKLIVVKDVDAYLQANPQSAQTPPAGGTGDAHAHHQAATDTAAAK